MHSLRGTVLQWHSNVRWSSKQKVASFCPIFFEFKIEATSTLKSPRNTPISRSLVAGWEASRNFKRSYPALVFSNRKKCRSHLGSISNTSLADHISGRSGCWGPAKPSMYVPCFVISSKRKMYFAIRLALFSVHIGYGSCFICGSGSWVVWISKSLG